MKNCDELDELLAAMQSDNSDDEETDSESQQEEDISEPEEETSSDNGIVGLFLKFIAIYALIVAVYYYLPSIAAFFKFL